MLKMWNHIVLIELTEILQNSSLGKDNFMQTIQRFNVFIDVYYS